MGLNIAIVGATGAVGAEFIKLLEGDVRKPGFEVDSIKLLASPRSAGKKLKFRGKEIEVEATCPDSFKGIDIAFFSAGAGTSKEFAKYAVEAGAVVIDNSSAFRMDEDVPLVVPEVNPEAAKKHKGIIANPNCSTIQMVVALNPIHKAKNIKRVIVSTYQAVSGTGAQAVTELENQLKALTSKSEITPEVYPVQIASNVIPHVDVFLENGYTKEEMKMVNETKKIMSAPEMQITATCVRVPVFRAHSEAINIETELPITAIEANELLSKAPGVIVKDIREPAGYPTPLDATETFETYVGRIREDISTKNGLSFWCVADQLYKGAALNAIQIAEVLQN